ncbi:hypothetical protein MNB_SV-4-196 [hydrothermal vent metagenome]|uniref:EF-hand domain-containing protein n=1 Tax=hydrothermal vent metagenome TaxID=652676 RepID=A0A1W1E6T1_9ZZZZ
MKKLALIALLATAAWSVDYSQMSTEELMKLRGTLSPAERPAFRAEMQKRMQAMSPQQRQQMMQGRRMGKGMGQGCGMRQGRQGMQNRPSYADFDLNHDGKVTQKEFYDAQAARMTQRAKEGRPMKNAANAPTFKTIDSNGDGVISESEFNTFRMQRMQAKRAQQK